MSDGIEKNICVSCSLVGSLNVRRCVEMVAMIYDLDSLTQVVTMLVALRPWESQGQGKGPIDTHKKNTKECDTRRLSRAVSDGDYEIQSNRSEGGERYVPRSRRRRSRARAFSIDSRSSGVVQALSSSQLVGFDSTQTCTPCADSVGVVGSGVSVSYLEDPEDTDGENPRGGDVRECEYDDE